MAKANTTINPILGTPRWAAASIEPDDLAPFPAKVVAASFVDKDAVKVYITAAGAAGNATSIPCTALVFPTGWTTIPVGTVLDFGGKKVARVATAPIAGATSIVVDAIPTALVLGDTAYYYPYGKRVAIPSGTFVGRTFAERAAGTGFGPVAAGDEELFLTAFDISDAANNNNISLLNNNRAVYENYLPEYSSKLNVAVDDVQTVTVAGSLSAGTLELGDGKGKVAFVAYNGDLAAIQVALDAIYGSSKCVAAGTIASFTVTFSGSGFTGVAQTKMTVGINGLTGCTSASVVHTTVGGKYYLDLLRSKYRTSVGVN